MTVLTCTKEILGVDNAHLIYNLISVSLRCIARGLLLVLQPPPGACFNALTAAGSH